MQEEVKSESVPRRFMDVIQHQIESGTLQPGDKLPTEREFAKQLKMSRGSVRIGIGCLTGMGVLEARRGVGTFLVDEAGRWRSSSLRRMRMLHGSDRQQVLEARLILESALAALAAERYRDEHLRGLAEEVAEMYAAVDCAQQFITHEMRFHRAVAEASGNSVLAAPMNILGTAAFGELPMLLQNEQQRRHTADIYREIYKSIRRRRPDDARRWMAAVLSPGGSAVALNIHATKIAG